MFNAIAAGVVGVALAASSLVLPVTALGDEGWEKGGRIQDSYSVEFTEENVVLTTEADAPHVEMELTKLIGVYSLDDLVDKNGLTLALEGDDAVAKFPYAIVGGGLRPNTSIVFHPAGSPDAPSQAQVQLTYYSNPDVWMTVDDFVSDVQDGTLKGLFGGEVTVGYTDTSNTDPYTATIDTLTFGGTTWDFGTGVEVPPAAPATKDDCKKGGWQDFDFRNQGQCIASL